MRTRLAVGAVGLLVGLYGAFLVLTRVDGFERLRSLVVWLAGGVVLHDLVLAPLVLGLAWAVRRVSPAWRRPGVVAVVCVGSLSLLAIPVLGRFGARSDNATLLDRPYLWSWLGLLVLTAVVVVAAGLLGARRQGREPSAADPEPAGD